MIDPKCFTAEWQAQKRVELGGCDPVLLEKTLLAFALLDALAGRGLEFIFKGGTSLILRLPRIRRLSIDADIICDQPDSELDRLLAEVSQSRLFTRMAEDERGSDRVPSRRHFKFFYVPLDPKNPAPFVLLGDKLTAFGPNTTGIPLNEHYSMQFMKQVFDIGELFDATSDLPEVRTAYESIFAAENRYRGRRFSSEQALEDAFSTAHCMAQVGLLGAPTDGRCELIELGRRQLESHLVGAKFRREEMKTAAAKAALLTQAIYAEVGLSSLRYSEDRLSFLGTFAFPDEFAAIRRLKAIPEAMWYWSMAARIRAGRH